MIRDGIATVDLTAVFASGGGSVSVASRLAQVTFTLTQFPGVRGVEFSLNGQRVTVFAGEGLVFDHPAMRNSFDSLTPDVLVESPAFGDTIRSPLRVFGTANTFEATFYERLVGPNGRVLSEEKISAASGTGTRGRFDVTVPYNIERSGTGTLSVYTISAKDGTHIPVSTVELRFVQ